MNEGGGTSANTLINCLKIRLSVLTRYHPHPRFSHFRYIPCLLSHYNSDVKRTSYIHQCNKTSRSFSELIKITCGYTHKQKPNRILPHTFLKKHTLRMPTQPIPSQTVESCVEYDRYFCGLCIFGFKSDFF